MRRFGLKLAVLLAAILAGGCGKTIQPTNYPTPFRGEFPVPHGPEYGAPYGQYYDDPGYANEPDYGYDERGYAAPEDYRWYSGREYRQGERRSGGYEYREYRESAPSYREHREPEYREYREPPHHEYREPPRREYAPPRHEEYEYERGEYAPAHGEYGLSHGGYGESFAAAGYAHAKDGGKLGHDFRYIYKYKLRDRVIKLDRYHLRKVKSFGYAAPPAAHAYSYVEHTVRYEKKHEARPKKVVKAKVKVRKERRAKKPVKTCTCTEEKRVEDVRRAQDPRVTVERYGKGYRLEMPAEILFSLDSDALRPEAQAIIRAMAGGLRAEKGAEIDVNGHADTAGSEEHNELLSQSRAVAVADALVKEGVDPVLVNPRGFGETVPRVVTPDGVREPRNRRVEILVMPAQG